MEMTLQELQYQERCNTGSSWTRNIPFEKNGYLICPKLWDPEELACPVPEITGQLNYAGKNPNQFRHDPVEQQVEGSTARYWHPQYRQIHSGIRLKLEGIIGRKLYNTYYYVKSQCLFILVQTYQNHIVIGHLRSKPLTHTQIKQREKLFHMG